MSPQQINRITNPQQAGQIQRQSPGAPGASNFGQLLQAEQEKQGVKVSSHAQKRMDQGNIDFSLDRQQRIEEAVTKMEEKGADKSLVLMDGVAFVVSVKNRTIITAVDEDRTKEGVFTNIDSAIII
jgi:flagellar operon protein